MRRREFVRTLMAAVVAPKLLPAQQAGKPQLPPPAPVPWTMGLDPGTPVPHTAITDGIAESTVRFFTQRQMETLTRLSDVLMPPVAGKPGALEAETPQFMDFLVGAADERRKKMYTGGLDWLDAQARLKYKTPFAKLDDEQAEALIKPWLRTWMSDHPPTEAHADFINIAHDEIREATVNSKAWCQNAPTTGRGSPEMGLYWTPIDPDLHGGGMGCTVVGMSSLGAPKSAIPVIPR